MSSLLTCKRGDVFYVDFSKDMNMGSEQYGARPVVIIQNDKGNYFSSTVIVAIITSKEKKKLPTHVPLIPSLPTVYGTICLEQIKTVDKSRLYSYRGNVGNTVLDRINKAISTSIGLSDIDTWDYSFDSQIVEEEKEQMNLVSKLTSLDNIKADWIEFAKKQMTFFSEVQQHIVNLSIEKQRLENEIESILSYIEVINLNVVQGYKVYHILKTKRSELRKICSEIEQLEILTSGFDCESMRQSYERAVTEMQNMASDNAVPEEIKTLLDFC